MSERTSLPSVLVIACGALAKELVELIRINQWSQVQVTCLPARLHNRPDLIPQAVRDSIHRHRKSGQKTFVAYGDCGTGGELDRVLQAEGVERIAGAHCYGFLAGLNEFEQLCDQEVGTFYLTDFLVRHFERLVISGLGLDRHPELQDLYFGNYRRLVYLAQTADDQLIDAAQRAARRLALPLEVQHTGLEPLAQALLPLVTWGQDECRM